MKALLITLVVLLGLLAVADRVAEGIAEDRVARQIAERGQLAGEPAVDITGWPFLTQALAGEYSDVRIALTAEQLGQPAGTTADVSLQGVQVPLSDVLGGSVAEIPVDRVEGTAALSWALLSEQLGGDTALTREGDGVRVDRTVEVFGQEVPLTAAGQVTLDGQDLVVTVEEASGAGVDLPDVVVDRASDLLDFRYSVPALPFGLQVTGLQVTDRGVDVDVEATDTVLR